LENEKQGQNNNSNEQPQKPRNNFIKTSVFMLLSIIVLVLIFWVFASQPKGEQISFDNFVSELEAGHIEKVELNAEKVNLKTKDGTWFWFHNREAGEEMVIAYCTNYNALVDSSNEANPSLQLTKVKIVFGKTTTISIMNIIYPILLILTLFLLVFFTFKQIKKVNAKGVEFTKNRARVSASKVKFDKVAGADEEKQELEEIIQFLKDPERFTKIGARIPKGVLLVGPPGTGKTLLARAVAGEANVPFFTISGSDFMELYVGVGASRVRDLFENAKKAKPCIVFIDEIDAVGRQRGTGLGGGNDEREQTLNQLLVQMDGFEPNEGIIVMAATNRADILDPALTRPGRFDRQIFINTPDVKGREEILKVHAEGKPLDKDVKLKEVARVTSGFTGADLENLLNEAAILAARQNNSKISMEDINNAIVKVSIGPQKRSRVVSEKDKRMTAYHEAGHAVVEKSVKTGNPVHEISIIQRGGAAGYTISRPDNDDTHMTRQKLIDSISVFLGGRAAEEIFLDDISAGASSDINRATNIARKMVTEWGMSSNIGPVNYSGEGNEIFLGRDYQTRTSYSEVQASKIDEEIKKIIDMCHKEATSILSKNKDKVDTMVEVLLEKETIYADEVDMIMNGSSKDEVVKYIEEKAKTKKEELKAKKEQEKAKEESKEEIKEESKNAGSYVDSLIEQAEKKLEELKKQENNENSAVKIEEIKVEEVKVEPIEVKEKKETKPKTTRKSTTNKKQAVEKKSTTKKDTNKGNK